MLDGFSAIQRHHLNAAVLDTPLLLRATFVACHFVACPVFSLLPLQVPSDRVVYFIEAFLNLFDSKGQRADPQVQGVRIRMHVPAGATFRCWACEYVRAQKPPSSHESYDGVESST